MDVTPRELRDMDIREGFRGYNRDDVDELLERAAATIEQLEEQLRRHQERLGALESDAGRGRENEEMLQRTLLLAQKTADEAIAEAQTRAKQMVEEAETRAYALVSEAEATARRMAMAEQRRLEAEVLGLGARREALIADIDNLERFEAEYRSRLRRAIEADLESLDARPTVSAGSRPALHEIELPSGEQQRGGEGALTPQPAGATASTAANASGAPAAPPAPPAPPIPPAPPMPADHDTITIDAVPPFPETAPSNAGSPPAVPSFADEPRDDARARDQLVRDDEPAEAQVLDDDAFFASLREAVRDDRPLGPAGDHDYDDEDDDSGRFGNVFKRRR